MQNTFGAPQQPRDFHKRSHAEANPLEEGELRGRPSHKSSRKKAKAMQPGRVVFLATDRQGGDGAHAKHPHLIVSSGPRRLEGMHQAASCVTLQPLPTMAELPQVTLPVSEVVPLEHAFLRTWREDVTRGTPLEQAMLEAADRLRWRREPPMTFSAVWRQLAPEEPEPSRG